MYCTPKKCLSVFLLTSHISDLLVRINFYNVHSTVIFYFQCPVVLLAGEATHEHYFSTTHGAYDTGQAQARVILDYLKGHRLINL
jgi:hypothetical protein